MSLARPSGHRLILTAADFAAERHRDQRRKGADAEPYVNHLIEVAALLSRSDHGEDAVLIAAGFLHDTIEDTGTKLDELTERFGTEVAAIVLEVTDDKRLSTAARKQLQIEQVTRKSHRAQLLTIADKTANVGSLSRSPPVGWSLGRIRDYATWAEAVVRQVADRDARLRAAFDDALAQARRRFA
jgi:(p)ppGpp synthase/HD superfamily hydrolase